MNTNGNAEPAKHRVVKGGTRVRDAGDRVTMDKVSPSEKTTIVHIEAPNFQLMPIDIQGTAKYVMNNFSQEARDQMRADMAKGQVDRPRGRKKLPPKDFDAGFRGSMHVSSDGWIGIPVTALRAALVRAAQLCGVEMTQAKMCLFVEADGYSDDGQGLIKITKGKAEKSEDYVRNRGGSPDIRARAYVAAGWQATVRLRYDADFMSASSVANLVQRAGICVGVGAGRPFSKDSVGQGWGTFEIVKSSTTKTTKN